MPAIRLDAPERDHGSPLKVCCVEAGKSPRHLVGVGGSRGRSLLGLFGAVECGGGRLLCLLTVPQGRRRWKRRATRNRRKSLTMDCRRRRRCDLGHSGRSDTMDEGRRPQSYRRSTLSCGQPRRRRRSSESCAADETPRRNTEHPVSSGARAETEPLSRSRLRWRLLIMLIGNDDTRQWRPWTLTI